MKRISILALIFSILSPNLALAQGADYSLSVTPPFFQMTITPGETWSSFIKLVNVNDFPITLYASAVNFESNKNENGKGKFTPLLSQDPEYKAASLAGWIEVTSDAINIAPGDTVKLPFTIRPPEKASPGGHYAAILIGNQPILDKNAGSGIAVSSLISSLIFARVSGDVIEKGGIREFSTEKTFYQEPEVGLSIRFENTGNVHLLPQGEITILNMWGKERGVIPVNQKTTFGNVLPESVRKFNFLWRGERSPLEIGRYTAITTLAFGSDERKNVSSITSFWVVPVVPVLTILGTLLALGFLLTWLVKMYIRRALNAEAARLGTTRVEKKAKALTQPIVDGVMDLRNIAKNEENETKSISITGFINKYKLFFLFLVIFVAGIMVIKLFFTEVLAPERGFEVEIDSELSVPFSGE